MRKVISALGQNGYFYPIIQTNRKNTGRMPTLSIHGWPAPVAALGNAAIIDRRKTAFLCSREYPAGAVLRIYDWAKAARERGECVISGFHSALERDVLEILLGGDQPIILAAARALPTRHSPGVRRALRDGQLLIASPFPASVARITAATARRRNEFMLSVAERIVVGYVQPGGALAQVLGGVAAHKEVIRLAV
ncbi:MAG: DNA-binding protein [Gammaproteobacteria bacterium]|nr:DNA-binding protein [Gammaproteobacteria bacterium]